jgi:hypothetical protein
MFEPIEELRHIFMMVGPSCRSQIPTLPEQNLLSQDIALWTFKLAKFLDLLTSLIREDGAVPRCGGREREEIMQPNLAPRC